MNEVQASINKYDTAINFQVQDTAITVADDQHPIVHYLTVLRYATELGWEGNIVHALMGIISEHLELEEAAQILANNVIENSYFTQEQYDAVIKECGDIFWFAGLLLKMISTSEDEMTQVFEDTITECTRFMNKDSAAGSIGDIVCSVEIDVDDMICTLIKLVREVSVISKAIFAYKKSPNDYNLKGIAINAIRLTCLVAIQTEEFLKDGIASYPTKSYKHVIENILRTNFNKLVKRFVGNQFFTHEQAINRSSDDQ